MVQQLLLVSRLAQPPRPTADVLAIGPRVQRAWDALGITDRRLDLRDEASGWLAVADGDQLDQVLWAILDNAVKYGEGDVHVEIGADPAARSLWTTIADEGRGLDDSDRAWMFGRFERGRQGGRAVTAAASGWPCHAPDARMGGDQPDEAPRPRRTFRLTPEPAAEA
jgi:signal transduction histidine kinase